MPNSSQHARPGERSDPNPFGRGCLPFTLVILVTLGIGGGIGWAVFDWIGAGIAAVLVLAAWIHFVWS